MFAVVPDPIPARMRVLNRAEVCDANFLEAVRGWRVPRARPAPDAPILPGSTLSAAAFGELFDSQLASRQLDLMARVLRVQNKVFYTIGSSGHEGNALLARACRHTDPAFLHYRSGAFMAERSRQVPGIDPLRDAALSFAASADDPASGAGTRCGEQAAVGAAADLDHRFAPAQGAGHRTGHREWQATGPGASHSGRQHRAVLVRGCLGQPCHGTDRIQHRDVVGLPEAAGTGPVRLRGQWPGHLGEDAGGLDRRAFRPAAGAGLLLRRWP